jgi:1,4-alpha-glucan branching enzyme
MTPSRTNGHGDLAIVLHTHMPYVESFGTWPFGEEWLWFCVAESYLRVAPVIQGKPVTLGVTPVLADQFEAMKGDAGDRMLAFYNDSREYCFGEDMRSFYEVGKGERKISLEPQLADYRSAAAQFEGELARDLNGLVKRLGESGVELLGGPATHPVVPLLATDFGVDLQMRVGAASHARRFGDHSNGIWLPECAYKPGTEALLARHGVGHFCLDQSDANGLESLDNLEPVATAAGPVAAPIDWHTVAQVWRADGFPVAQTYRSSFKRTIHSLMPYNNAGEAWNIDAARAQAHAHAAAFVRNLAARLEVYADERGKPGLCVFAIDTELLGHWWYEGPWWLEQVIAQAQDVGINLVTLADGIARRDPVTRPLVSSSWGESKDFSTWDSPAVAGFGWQARAAELELFDLLGHDAAAALRPEALRAARELLAMQSSDWAFIAKRETAGDYASNRFAGHLAAYERAASSLRQSARSDGGEGIATDVARLAPDLSNEVLAETRFPPIT